MTSHLGDKKPPSKVIPPRQIFKCLIELPAPFSSISNNSAQITDRKSLLHAPQTLFYYFSVERLGRERKTERRRHAKNSERRKRKMNMGRDRVVERRGLLESSLEEDWLGAEFSSGCPTPMQKSRSSSCSKRLSQQRDEQVDTRSLKHNTPPELPESIFRPIPKTTSTRIVNQTFLSLPSPGIPTEERSSESIVNEILFLRERIRQMEMEQQQPDNVSLGIGQETSLSVPVLSERTMRIQKSSAHKKVHPAKKSISRRASTSCDLKRTPCMPPPPQFILRISSVSSDSPTTDSKHHQSPSKHNLHFTMRCHIGSLQTPSEIRDCILYHSEENSHNDYISSKSFVSFIRDALYSNEYTSQWIQMDPTPIVANMAPDGIFLTLYPLCADGHCSLHFRKPAAQPTERAFYDIAVAQSIQPEQVETFLHHEWYGSLAAPETLDDESTSLSERQNRNTSAVINAATQRFDALKKKQLELRRQLNTFELSGKLT